ncbi:peptidase S8/S53 domain-containing protein [Paraphysoderma sedebokerense]|nr:peptidase S8/S53 domain-containing protein [Paraphysoderma sedebokerense]
MQLLLLGTIIISAASFTNSLPSVNDETGYHSVRQHRRDVIFSHERTIPKSSEPLPEDDSYWYLDQLDGKKHNQYTYPEQAGDGIDTGINVEHEIFGGRAVNSNNFIPSEENKDLAGHGTRVAGIAAKVAKKSNIIGIRVLDSKGRIHVPSNDAKAISWAAGVRFAVKLIKAAKKEAKPVLNLSFGTLAQDKALDAAVKEARDAGIVVVIAAGDDKADSCIGSPNGVFSSILVGNVKRDHTLAADSQFGHCIDIGAYGTDLLTASENGPNTYTKCTCTSCAAPVVSGLVAILLSMGIPPSNVLYKLRGLSSPTTVMKGLTQPLTPLDDTPVLSTTTSRIATLELMDNLV